VVGSGPAGFYTVDKILKKYQNNVRVDLLDQLPTPFGLVRSGVAPDHPETKNVEHQFANTARDPRVTFLGHVRVGSDIQLAELRRLYSGVVLAYGAESDKQLSIPGEEAGGVLPARRFVWWYNGHPAGASEEVDLANVRSVAILGLGNVALDCARVLLTPPEQLAPTDIAERALHQLRRSNVETVHLIARRSHAEAACTPKELREITALVGPNVHFNTPETVLSPPVVAKSGDVATNRIRKRLLKIFQEAGQGAKPEPGARQLQFHFLRSPIEVLTSAKGNVRGVQTKVMKLETAADGRPPVAVGTDAAETIQADLVLVSIGYRPLPIAGAGFEPTSGVILNRGGRVLDERGEQLDGVYACGWLSRGPSGIIGTNLQNALQLAEVIGEDTARLKLVNAAHSPTNAVTQLLDEHGVQYTTLAGWDRIDAKELREGQQRQKVREKLATLTDLMHVAHPA